MGRQRKVASSANDGELSDSQPARLKGKKKGKGGKHQREEESAQSDDDLATNSSRQSSTNNLDQDLLDPDQEESDQNVDMKLNTCLDRMGEKRTSERIVGLKGLCRLLSHNYLFEQVMSKQETIFDILKKSVRRGEPEEVDICGKGYHEHDPMIVHTIELFKEVFRSSENVIIQRTALRILCLCGMMQEESVTEWFPFLVKILRNRKVDSEVVQAAIKSYGVLCSCLNPDEVEEYVASSFNSMMRDFHELLHINDVTIRVASGELIALLMEMSEEGKMAGNKKWRYDGMNELMKRVQELINDSSKHQSKKDRTLQKGVLRDVFRALEGDTSKANKISVLGQVYQFTTWKSELRLEFVKSILGEGFDIHCRDNSFVQNVLELEDNGASKQYEKGLDLSRKEAREMKYARMAE